MTRVVRIPEGLFNRLQNHAEPLVDSVGDVIERILDEYEDDDSLIQESVKMNPSNSFKELWTAVVGDYNRRNPKIRAKAVNVAAQYRPLRFGHKVVHYEWVLRSSKSSLDVCLHFESKDRDQNYAWVNELRQIKEQICDGVDIPFEAGRWGRAWAQAMFRIRYNGIPDANTIEKAGATMKLFVDRTWDFVHTLGEYRDGNPKPLVRSTESRLTTIHGDSFPIPGGI